MSIIANQQSGRRKKNKDFIDFITEKNDIVEKDDFSKNDQI